MGFPLTVAPSLQCSAISIPVFLSSPIPFPIQRGQGAVWAKRWTEMSTPNNLLPQDTTSVCLMDGPVMVLSTAGFGFFVLRRLKLGQIGSTKATMLFFSSINSYPIYLKIILSCVSMLEQMPQVTYSSD